MVTLPWLVIYMLLGTLFAFVGNAAVGTGIPSWWIAVAIGGGGFVLVLSQPWFGRLSDRWGRFRMMTIGAFGFVGILVGASLVATVGPKPYAIAVVGVSVPAALAYGPAALAALADVSRSISRGTTMAVYSLVISAGMIVGLFGSANLYARFGAPGLDAFFGAVAVGLLGLTALRGRDLRTGRAREGPQATNGASAPEEAGAPRSDAGGSGATIPAR
jgi:MFS family permease